MIITDMSGAFFKGWIYSPGYGAGSFVMSTIDDIGLYCAGGEL